MSLDTCKFTFPLNLKQSLHDKSWSQDDTTDKKWTFEHEVEKASSYRRPFLRTCPLLHVNQTKKISTACGGRFIQSTKVPHSIKNAFVLNRHENKTSRTIRLIINPLICHVIYRTKSIEVVKYYQRTIRNVDSDRFSVTRIEYYQDYRDRTGVLSILIM